VSLRRPFGDLARAVDLAPLFPAPLFSPDQTPTGRAGAHLRRANGFGHAEENSRSALAREASRFRRRDRPEAKGRHRRVDGPTALSAPDERMGIGGRAAERRAGPRVWAAGAVAFSSATPTAPRSRTEPAARPRTSSFQATATTPSRRQRQRRGGRVRSAPALSSGFASNFSKGGLYPFALYCALEIVICLGP
jgi:hypothetical protein